MTSNSLLSTHKISDSGLQVLLHPLVLLTISDHITRHTLRRHEGPIIGALLGQQNGRDISLEHAFDCKVVPGENDEVLMHQSWFEDRLQQFKDVHKAPALELIGWFTIAPTLGPQPEHLPIHRQILHTYNESAVLLAFHPSVIAEGATAGGKLPLTIYESVYEDESLAGQHSGEEDKAMQVEGQEPHLSLRFRELPYSVETGEAEMISVDFVARGGGNATAVDGGATKTAANGQASQAPVGDVKTTEDGNKKEVDGVDSSLLSPEDEELIASLTARSNAVKMLHSRIQLMRSYLATLPPSYLTTPTSAFTSNPPPASDPKPEDDPQPQPPPHSTTTLPADSQSPQQPHPTPTPTPLSHPPLRAIQSLLHRLPLLQPPDQHTFAREVLAEKADVSLVALLGCLGKSIKDAREMGRKFAVVEQGRGAALKRGLAGGGGMGGIGGGVGGGMGGGEEGFGEGMGMGMAAGERGEAGLWG